MILFVAAMSIGALGFEPERLLVAGAVDRALPGVLIEGLPESSRPGISELVGARLRSVSRSSCCSFPRPNDTSLARPAGTSKA